MSRGTKSHSARLGGIRRGIQQGFLSLLTFVVSSQPVPCAFTRLRQEPTQRVAGEGSVIKMEQDVHPLELGKPIERELKGGEVHSYTIVLAAGQYVHLVVDQRGIDVVVTLFGPDGKQIIDVDSPNGTQGPEPVSVVSESSGTYRLDVRSLEKNAVAGRYEVKVEELRGATSQDKNRLAAERLLAVAMKVFLWGEQLRSQGTADSLRRALHKYEEALPLFHSAGDRGREATALNNIGVIYHNLNEQQNALQHYNQALPLYRVGADQRGEATTLNNIGRAYDELGEKHNALDSYNQALLISRASGERVVEATTLGNIGAVYHSLGEPRKALEYYHQVLPIFRALGDKRTEGATLSNIGRIYDDLGEKQDAFYYLNRALPISRELRDRQMEATTLDNIGVVYDSIGEKQKALEYYTEALQLVRAVGNHALEAVSLSNIGSIYASLGEPAMALAYYHQAMELGRTVQSHWGEEVTLNKTASTYRSLGDHQKALEYYRRALLLMRTIGDRRGEAATLHGLGTVYDSLGEKQKALDYYLEALPVWRAISDRYGEANTLSSTGWVFASLGESQRALHYYGEALLLSRAVRHSLGEVYSLAGIAYVERNRGNLQEARTQIERALPTIESLRAKVVRQELRASFLASMHQAYEFYIGLLMSLHEVQPAEGFDVLALQASERGLARSLVETLMESRADIRRAVDPALVERERLLLQMLNAKADRQIRITSHEHTDEQAATAAREVEQIRTELQEVQAQIRSVSPGYAALTQPQPLTLREIQEQVLDHDTVLLEYALGEERSFLFTVGHDSIVSYELPKRAELEAKARRLVDSLTARSQLVKFETADEKQGRISTADMGYSEAALALSQMILGPVAPLLAKKRLLIVADGALQYVPFGALPIPRGTKSIQKRQRVIRRSGSSEADLVPLMLEHEIVNIPSASTLAVLRRELAGRKQSPKSIAVLADPVFDEDDERVKALARDRQQEPGPGPDKQKNDHKVVGARGEASETKGLGEVSISEYQLARSAREAGLIGFDRLRFTRQEAEGITALVPVSEAKKALDFSASKAAATSPDLSQYRMVHFATHGLLDSQHPELSGLVFSRVDEQGKPQDGFLRLNDLYNLNLPAEVVVLSACKTGLGKEIKGEGLIGLTRGFMYAGAKCVVVSLWDVNDASTAELMVRFYRGMLQKKMRPAAALRAAQISIWREKRWNSPYFWAAFQIQGEWR